MAHDQQSPERPPRPDHVKPADLEEHERPPASAEARRQGDGDDRAPEATSTRGAGKGESEPEAR